MVRYLSALRAVPPAAISFLSWQKRYGRKDRWNGFIALARLNPLTFGLSALIAERNQPIETAEHIRSESIRFTPRIRFRKMFVQRLAKSPFLQKILRNTL